MPITVAASAPLTGVQIGRRAGAAPAVPPAPVLALSASPAAATVGDAVTLTASASDPRYTVLEVTTPGGTPSVQEIAGPGPSRLVWDTTGATPSATATVTARARRADDPAWADPIAANLVVPLAAGATGTTCPLGQWDVSYFNNTAMAGTAVLRRCESPIGGDWGAASPVPGTVDADNWSLRAEGSFSFAAAADYVFTLGADDGVRFYVDGVRVLDRWAVRAYATDQVRVTVAPSGNHLLRLEYFAGTGTARLDDPSWQVYVAPPPNPPASSGWQALIDATPQNGAVELPEGTYRPNGGQNPFPLVVPRGMTVAGLVVGGAKRSLVRGADAWTDWVRSGTTWVSGTANSYGGVVPTLPYPGEPRIFASARSRIAAQVFVDEVEQELVAEGSTLSPGRAILRSDRRIVLGSDPTGRLVEVAVVPTLVSVRASDATVRDLDARYGVPAYQAGLLSKRQEGVHRTSWLNNDVRHSYQALIESYWGNGDKIVGNHLAYGGHNGWDVGGRWGAFLVSGYEITDNLVEWVNWYGFNVGWHAGCKMTWATDSLIARNTVLDPAATAIWCDTNCDRLTFDGNVVRRGTGVGLMYEVSSGPATVRNNTIDACAGDGVLGWTACGMAVTTNTVTNCGTGIRFWWQSSRTAEFTGSSCGGSGNSQSGNTFGGNGQNVVQGGE